MFISVRFKFFKLAPKVPNFTRIVPNFFRKVPMFFGKVLKFFVISQVLKNTPISCLSMGIC